MKEQLYKLEELKMDIIDNDLAKKMICKFHYSNTCPQLKIAFAFKVNNEIKNIICYTTPIGRLVSKEIMDDGDENNTLELIRMISIEPKPRNVESYCIHKTFEYLKKYLPQYKIIISMADNSIGHYGYCYQASGFVYYGQSAKHRELYLDGKRIHERSLFGKYGTANVNELRKKLGERIVVKRQEKTKSRYYYIIAQNKKEKKEIQKKIKVNNLPFPKGQNQRYNVFLNNSFANLDGRKSSDTEEVIQGQTTIFDYI